jgi:hypothetical protein
MVPGGSRIRQTAMHASTPALLDPFMPNPDVRGRHEITIHAPAGFVMNFARSFPIESLWLVRALFRLRAALLRSQAPSSQPQLGLVDQMRSIGWQCLAEDPLHYFIAGAACRPWQPQPGFSPIAPERFAAFAEPDRVKIAWTLESAESGPALTRFATETRVVATDPQSRVRFKRYWRKFGVGIVLIRLVLLFVLRRRAERLWREHDAG